MCETRGSIQWRAGIWGFRLSAPIKNLVKQSVNELGFTEKRKYMIEKNIILKSEKFMLECINKDSAHDKYHIYRVLNLALTIAESEENVDLNLLIISCLLHDIGRQEQYDNPELCHAKVGGRKAYDFLISEGVDANNAMEVRKAIESHRFRTNHIPISIEAKILFDADTIDATGAMGIARSLQYEGKIGIPLYNVNSNGNVLEGRDDINESFFKEYESKLKILYDRLFTVKGKEIANQRREIAREFYQSLKIEVSQSHSTLECLLDRYSFM